MITLFHVIESSQKKRTPFIPLGVHRSERRTTWRARIHSNERRANAANAARGSLNVGRIMWRAFKKGRTATGHGSIDGVVVLDEMHPKGARITLVRDGSAAPWSITCEIAGTFAHTATAASEDEARRKYSAMQHDLQAIMEDSSSTPCYEKLRLFADVY